MQGICRLAAGDLRHWQGLQPFALHEAPACLEPTGESGWLRFGWRHLVYQRFRRKRIHSEVWLFADEAEMIQLVEVFQLPTKTAPALLLSKLGTPDGQLDYPLAAQLQRPFPQLLTDLKEWVFAARGLAILIGQTAEMTLQIARIRGFGAMPAHQYQARFVDLPAIRFFSK